MNSTDVSFKGNIVTSTPSAKADRNESAEQPPTVKPLAQYFMDSENAGSGDFFDCVTTLPESTNVTTTQDSTLPESSSVDAAQEAIADITIEDTLAVPAVATEQDTIPQRPVKSVSFQQDLSQHQESQNIEPDALLPSETSSASDLTSSSHGGRVRHTSVSEEIPVAFEVKHHKLFVKCLNL